MDTNKTPIIIPIDRPVYNSKARGVWCATPYGLMEDGHFSHPKGCPNIDRCMREHKRFTMIDGPYNWFAIVEYFDLAKHARTMKEKHPSWKSERQLRNPRYWQGGVCKRLKEAAEKFGYDLLLEIPEATGIEVFETMKKVGIIIEKTNPQIVAKVMIVGKWKK